MRISVIIPAYQAEDTIRGCLDSIVGQADQTIVVDDGSSDGTASLVESEYPSVILVRQENQGVAVARNTGMGVAQGDYIVFSDADDNLYAGALAKAKESLRDAIPDLVILRSFTGETEQYPWIGRFVPGHDYGLEDIVGKGYVRGSVWGCLYRRAFLEKHSLSFPGGISMAEDQLFLNAVIARGAVIRFLDIPLYHFNVRSGSLSRSYGDHYFRRLSDALLEAPRMIPDTALCTHVQLSILLGMAKVAVLTGRSARWVMRNTELEKALPLSLAGLKKGRLVARLTNLGFPFLYDAVRIRLLFQ